jgi:16S rRNA (guanine527-N7)-methyltransferase
MKPARIAELLEPFLRAPISPPGIPTLTKGGHSGFLAEPLFVESVLAESFLAESTTADEPSPEHDRESAPSVSKEEPTALSPIQLHHISTYIDILVHWNARINLTAIRDPEDIVTRHFGESFFAARHLFPGGRAALKSRVAGQEEMRALAPEALTVADLGSGAGFPGLPIKLWAEHISLTLIESNHKKAAFLREVARALTLTDVDIQNTRAESVSGAFDVVTLRAVEHFAAILPTAAALVAPSGRLALLISAAQQAQAREALPHLSWSTPTPIPHSRSRILLSARRPLIRRRLS